MTAILSNTQLRDLGSAPRKLTAGLPPATVLLSFAVVLVVILWSLVPGLFTSLSPVTGDTASKLAAPSAAHWFGTDYLGRDQYARVVYGTASSVTSALVAVLIGLVIGSIIGLASGFRGGWVDASWDVSSTYCWPSPASSWRWSSSARWVSRPSTLQSPPECPPSRSLRG